MSVTPAGSGNGRRACVIIPAYNAASTLGPLIARIRQLTLDAVVVNDGSTDDTANVATASGALVISHLANRGKGAAIRSGFAFALEAGYEAVVTLDSDGQHDPDDIPRLLEAAAHPEGALILGHRALERWRMPPLRRWTNDVMSAIVSAMTRQRIPDSQCGFRVVRREALETLRLSSRRFDIETEVVLAAARAGWRIGCVPIRTIYAGHASHIRPLADGLRFFRLVLRYLVAPPQVPRHGL